MSEVVNQEPVFIVGAPRSGTTLLAAMLDAHSKLSCGPETHFFRKLAQVNVRTLIAQKSWPEKALQFVSSIEHTSSLGSAKKFLLNKYQIEPAEVARFLEHRSPEVSHILESVTVQYMERMGKRRWVEKTPDHLEYVATIRLYFPDSPIIRIVRDPRDVALSLTKVPWGVRTVTEALMFLRRLDDNSASFFATDGNVHTLYYEDLITDPEGTLKSLCNFIGEPFEEGMLDTSRTGKQINSRNAPWKEKVSEPVDKSRLEVWREELSETENLLAEAIFGDRIAAYGYPVTEKFLRRGVIFPDEELIIKYGNWLGSIAAQGVRFWSLDEDEEPSAFVFLGDPGDALWLGKGRWERLSRAWMMAWMVFQAATFGKKVYWLVEEGFHNWSGVSAGWLKLALGIWSERIVIKIK